MSVVEIVALVAVTVVGTLLPAVLAQAIHRWRVCDRLTREVRELEREVSDAHEQRRWWQRHAEQRAEKHRAAQATLLRRLSRVLAACDSERARASLAALLCTGLRIEELRRVHVGALREQGDGFVLTVEPEAGPADAAWTTKGYRAREIPLSAAAGKAVLAYLRVTVGPRKAVVQESWLLRKLAAACERVGVPRAGVHDTRRSFVTECYRAGVALAVIATWCGHADVRTTEGYLSSYRSDRQVVAPTPGALTPAPPPAEVIPLAESRLNVGGDGGAGEARPGSRRRTKTA